MLKQEFEDILKEYGTNILLVRTDTKLRCSCWSEKHQTADRDCPVCFGLGTVPVIEKHTVRSITLTIPQSLPKAVGVSSLGPVAYSSKAFYLKSEVKVESGDLIIEVDWSPTGKPIYTGGDISDISYVENNRFERGEIIFKKAYVSNKSIESEVRGIRIANSNGIKNYEVLNLEKRGD